MPIEFHCTGCRQQLRVSDESAGKNAKCPKCGTIVVVPSAGGLLGAAPSGYPSESQPPWQVGEAAKLSGLGGSAPGASPRAAPPPRPSKMAPN